MSFCGFLKQSTAVDILLGPCVDDTDGKTAETGLTLDAEVSKNGQALANKTDATVPVHDAAGTVDGYYNCELDATDTGTLGIITVVVHAAGFLPCRQDYQIVTANWWDTMCSTDLLQSDLTQIGGVAQSATDLKDFADAGYDPATNKVQGVVLTDTCTANSDLVTAANVVDEWETQANTDPTGFKVNVMEINGTSQTANDNGADINTLITEVGKVPKSDGAASWNATALTAIESECNDALVAQKLDHLVAVADSDDPVNNSIVAKMAASDGDWSGFSAATDSLEAVRDQGDSAWITSTLTAANVVDEFETQSQADPTGFHVNVLEVNGTGQTANDNAADINTLITEVGKVPKSDGSSSWNATALTAIEGEVTDSLVAHNLDHLCKTATAAADMTTEVADNTILSRVLANGDTSAFDPTTDGLQLIYDALVAVKAITDVIPDAGALTDIDTGINNLETRLSAARGGYLDELNVATAGKTSFYVSKIAIDQINKKVITEATGNTEQFNDAGASIGTVAAAYSTDGTFTTRKRMVI